MELFNYIEIRRKLPVDEISLGYRTVAFFSPSEIEDEQLGYSIGPNGEDLTGSNHGDWRRNWLVVAREDLNGDPIFVDLEGDELPVYTAVHGTGAWVPLKIAPSFSGFVKALQIIDTIGRERRNPVQFQNNPLSDSQIRAVLAEIEHATGLNSRDFWTGWFDI